jgi:hypothetical protein
VAAGLVTGPALYYALGGGLGHLTRARAVLATLGLRARVLCASPFAPRFPDLDRLPVPAAARDPATFRPWLQALLAREYPHTLYLDSFPAGLFGELCGLPLPAGMRVEYLARGLAWPAYRQRLGPHPPPLARAWLLEPLDPDHRAWLQARQVPMAPLSLDSPAGSPAADPVLLARLAALPMPRWLIVHSGPAEETRHLLAYARDQAAAEGLAPCLVLITPDSAGLPADLPWLPLDPARAGFPLAQRLISACGFNLMQETAPYRAIHRFLPLPRALDDQFARARRARLGTAGAARGADHP